MGQQQQNNPKPNARKRTGPVRRALRLLALAIVVLFGVSVIGHTIIIREVAERTLARQVGCSVSIGTARIGPGGSIVLRDVRLRAPGVPGAGGVFLESASATAEIDWTTLLAGGQGVRRIRLVDPVVRLSQDAQTGQLNLLRVGGAGGGTSGGAGRTVTPLPEVEFVSGRVEFGEHSAGVYSALASIPVEGQVRVPSIAIPEYEIDLVEVVEPNGSGGPGDHAGRPPMRLTGDFNVESLTGELRMVDLDLDHWRGWSAPIEARALWKQLDIRGRIAEASFTASKDSSVTAWFKLDGVRLTAPIEAPGLDASLIRASDVDGVIRFTPGGLSAELVGIVEDLPVKMEFKTDGLRVTAPLSCTITTDRFRVIENPGLLRFIPAEARDLFDKFGGPTGEVSGYVTLSRGAPLGSEPAPIVARGELRIEDGRGEAEAFPYLVEQISGAVRFDENIIELIDIRGVSPTGATLIASGTIAPPTEGTEVNVEMKLGGIPTDEALERAMPAEARRVLRTLIHEPALDELRDRGLLLTGADRAALEQRRGAIEGELEQNQPGGDGSAVKRVELLRESAAIDRRLQTPVFDVGGLAEATVLMERHGSTDELHTTIDIRLERAGLLPEPFPYPFIAKNFNVVVTPEGATATAEQLDGLTGARADLIAAITFPDTDSGEPGATLIDIDIEHAPFDRLLLAATPSPGGAGAGNLFDALTGLDVGGELTGAIVIDSAEPDGFRADLRLRDLRLTLPGSLGGEQQAVEVTGLRGPMTVTDTRVVVGPITGDFRGSPVTVRGLWREPEPGAGPSPIHAEVELDGFNLATRVDPVIELLGEGAAARWATLRDSRSITGELDLTTSIELLPGRSPKVRTTLRNIKDLSFVAYGGPVEIDRLSGEIVADAGGLRLLNCAGQALLDGRLTGLLTVNGAYGFDELGAMNLDATLTRTEFDAAFLNRLSNAEEAPESLRHWLDERRPSGITDILLLARRDPGEALDWSLELTPRVLDIRTGEDTLTLRGSGDSVVVRADGGWIEHLHLEGESLSIDLSGSWRYGDRAAVDLDFTMGADHLTPAMQALMPDDVAGLFQSLEIGINDKWRLTRGELRWRTDSQRFVGEAEFTGLSGNPGIDITDAVGRAVMLIDRSEEQADPEIEIEITTDRMRLAGVGMTDGALSLHTVDLPGRLLIDQLTANAHGGRVTGLVTIDTTTQASMLGGDDAPDGVWYEAGFDFAGVEVESLLNEVATIAGDTDGKTGGETTPIEGFTGRFDGRLTVAGSINDERTRRGRGVFRIQGGELLMAPLMVPIIELSNLRAPSGESLERADAEVYIDGPLVHVEQLRVRSDSISIIGTGAVTWPGLDLQMSFNSRSNYRVPILSDLVEGLRNGLITTVVTGTFLSPEFRTETLPGTKPAFDEMIGSDETRSDKETGPIRRSAGAEGVSSVLPTRPPDTP